MKPVDGWDLVAELVWHPLGMVPYPWLLMSIRRHGVDMPLNALVKPLEEDGLVTRFYLPSGEWFMPGPVALADAGMVAPESPPPFDPSEIKPAAEDFDWEGDFLSLFEALPWAAPTAAVVLDLNGTPEQWPDLSEPSFFPAAVDTLGLIEREYLPALPDPGAEVLAAEVLGAAWRVWSGDAAVTGAGVRECLPGPGGIPLTPIESTLTGWILSDGLFRSGQEMVIRSARHPSTRQRLEVADMLDMLDEIKSHSRRRMERAARSA